MPVRRARKYRQHHRARSTQHPRLCCGDHRHADAQRAAVSLFLWTCPPTSMQSSARARSPRVFRPDAAPYYLTASDVSAGWESSTGRWHLKDQRTSRDRTRCPLAAGAGADPSQERLLDSVNQICPTDYIQQKPMKRVSNEGHVEQQQRTAGQLNIPDFLQQPIQPRQPNA